MAVYTNLDKNDVINILNNYGISFKTFKKIESGILNTNYYIESFDEKFVLRVFEGKRGIFEENQELELLLNLKNIIPCCTPVKTILGKNYVVYKNRMIALFYFIEGEPLKIFNANCLYEIGKYLGKFHSFSLNQELNRKSRIDLQFYYNKINFNKLNIPLGEKRKILKTYDEIKNFDFSLLPRGIVHNDIFPDNVLIKNNHIVGILDFNEAQSGAFIFDIAIVINYWIKIYKFPKNEEEYHISLFLKEYEKYRKLELGEKRALEIAIKKVNLTFILLRLDKFINENLPGVLIENKSYSELLTLLD